LTKKDLPPFKPVDLPTSPVSAQDDANIFITDYIINSATYTLHNTKQLQYAVLPEDVPSSSPIKLNTTSLKTWLPELYNKYPNKGVRIDLETTVYPQTSFSPSSINIVANTTLLFSVYNDDQSLTKAFLLGLDVFGRFLNASVTSAKAGTVINVFGNAQCMTNMRLVESYIGDLNITTFSKIMQLIIVNGQIAALNKKLAAGLPIDLHQLLPGLIIDNSKIVVNTGYIAVSARVTYIPPVAKPSQDKMGMVVEILADMLQQMEELKNKIVKLEARLGTSKCENK
jgi:hypothetical protein